MVDDGRRGGCPLTGLTGALNPSLGSSGAPAPRRGAHFESLARGSIDAQTPVLAADVPGSAHLLTPSAKPAHRASSAAPSTHGHTRRGLSCSEIGRAHV